MTAQAGAAQPPRPLDVALLASVFVVAACGLVYELAAGALASYLLGDSVLQFSTVIGTYLFAMGVGSWLSRYFERQLPAHFLRIELLVALAGGLLPSALFLTAAYLPGAFRIALYGLVLLVGLLVGLEIPLVMRILKRNVALRDLVSQVLTFDYLGALAVSVAFPLVLVPHLGLIRTGLLFGLMNAAVAVWALWLFRHELRRFAQHAAACAFVLAALVGCFFAADHITTLAEDKFYQDRVVLAETTPWQRIVLTHGSLGYRLFLNGNLQFAERDEYRYHEALVHPAMSAFAAGAAPRHVAVLGGGDGMAVREILKYPGVQQVTLVELDPAMTRLFSTRPELVRLNGGSLLSPKVRTVNADAFKWLEDTQETFDVIVVDFPDPTNFSIGKLYTTSFYALLEKRLSASGYAVIQTTSPLVARRSFWTVAATLEAVGLRTAAYHAHVPSFGEWGYIIAGRRPYAMPADTSRLPAGLRFLNPQTLALLFDFPQDMARVPAEPNRLSNQVLVTTYEQEWGQGGPVITRRTALLGSVAPLAVPLAAALPGCAPAPSPIEGGFAGIDAERGHMLRNPRAWPAPAVTRRTGTVIAGGGVAGLAAARALRLAGRDDFALLELENAPGGNSRAGVVGGIPCPLGAHYLPTPGPDAHEVQDLLEEYGLRQRVAGRWQFDERHLCHSPQERLYFNGEWQEGLLPVQGVPPETIAQYRRFARDVDAVARRARFSIPAFRAGASAAHAELHAQTFARWLDARSLTDPHLRWYLDYCCRDDYGAGIQTVSAWAGLHYFASRHGFQAPGADRAEGESPGGILTWPEGNAWLGGRLAAPVGDRAHTACTVLRIGLAKHGVEVDAFNHRARQVERWLAANCVVALPLFIAARVVEGAPAFLSEADARTPHAPWLVANLHIREPLQDRPGAPPSWDNVLYGSRGLGYVDARHQSLDPRPGATVLTCYRALGDEPDGRGQLLRRPWTHWRDIVLSELAVPHPDLAAKAVRVEITRYGHAMAVPVPRQLATTQPPVPRHGRLLFAHADWAGYSIFEEAFTRGHLAGGIAARAG